MADELKIRTSALADYVCDGNDALDFKLVNSAQDLDDEETSFKPEMCHQIYGDNENIFGYKGLKVSLYMSRGSLQSFVTHEYQDKVDPAKTDGVTADDVIARSSRFLLLAASLTTKISSFHI